MTSNSIQKRVAVALESGTLAAPATIDFDSIPSPGGLMATTVVEDAGLKRAYVDDEIITTRASDTRAKLRGLRSGAQAGLAPYMAGQTSGHAAAGAAGAQDLLGMVMATAWGGQNISGGATIAAGTSAAPELDLGEGALFGDYTWGYFWDDSAALGYFRQITSVSTDTLTMTTGHELPFTPEVGVDRVYAVEATYQSWPVCEDYSHVDHDLLQVLLAGRQADDLYLLQGVKPELQLGTVEAGAPTVMTVPLHAVQFEGGDSLVITPALAQSLSGAPGPIVGAGATTSAHLVAVGATLANVQFWGGITHELGLTPERIMGPNGTEGVAGFGVTADSYKAGAVELIVPYDSTWRTASEAGTEYTYLLQVGNAVTGGPWGVYCPRLTFTDDVEAGSESNARRQQTLRFGMREAQIDVSALSADAAERARAKVVLLRVA